MRVREQTYWEWADAQLHSRCHDEVLSDGTVLDIQCGCRGWVPRNCFSGYMLETAKPCWRSTIPRAPVRP